MALVCRLHWQCRKVCHEVSLDVGEVNVRIDILSNKVSACCYAASLI